VSAAGVNAPTESPTSGEGLFHPRRLLRYLLRDAAGMTGLFLLLVVVACAVFAPWIAPYGPNEGDLMAARLPPVWHPDGTTAHLLGTDQLGQDLFRKMGLEIKHQINKQQRLQNPRRRL
jgi:ABC-type antimicrobial peptide transport system permease subunit